MYRFSFKCGMSYAVEFFCPAVPFPRSAWEQADLIIFFCRTILKIIILEHDILVKRTDVSF